MMNKPLLSELKVGMHIWLPALLVGRSEGWSYTYTYKKKWARGIIVHIKGSIIGVSEEDWTYYYEFDYEKDIFGKDWNIF